MSERKSPSTKQQTSIGSFFTRPDGSQPRREAFSTSQKRKAGSPEAQPSSSRTKASSPASSSKLPKKKEPKTFEEAIDLPDELPTEFRLNPW